MTTITEHEMKRRALVAKLQSRIIEVIGEFEVGHITYQEALTAVHNVGTRLMSQLQLDEWREQ